MHTDNSVSNYLTSLHTGHHEAINPVTRGIKWAIWKIALAFHHIEMEQNRGIGCMYGQRVKYNVDQMAMRYATIYMTGPDLHLAWKHEKFLSQWPPSQPIPAPLRFPQWHFCRTLDDSDIVSNGLAKEEKWLWNAITAIIPPKK